MKPETAPTIGQAVETTTIRRIVPAQSTSGEPKTPDLWDYLAEVERTNDWDRHIIYVHRVDPTPSVPVQKCQRYFWTPDNQQIPVFDQQEMEFALLKHFGGKRFRLMVKRGAQLMCTGHIFVDAPPRSFPVPADVQPLPNSGSQITGMSTPGSEMAAIAGKAMDTVASQEKEAVSIGLQAMATAANVVKSFANGNGEGSELDRALKQAMINRLLAPPPPAPDPMDQLVKILTVVQTLNTVTGAGGGSGMPAGMVEKILNLAFEKLINPQPAGAPVSASAELMRQLPQLGTSVVEGLREFARAREAEANIVAMSRGQNLVRPAGPVAPNPQVIPPVTPSSMPAPGGNGAPTMDFVEQKLVEILAQPVSAEQAADDALAFLSPLDPRAVEMLANLGEKGLLELFTKRPILSKACSNMPRLVEFIRAFLRMYAEDLAAAHAAPPSTAPTPGGTPPLPN